MTRLSLPFARSSARTPSRNAKGAGLPWGPALLRAVSIAFVYQIGLTGGIASGKSVVTARLAERGAVVIDADRLARDVVAPGTPGLAALADRFGPSVIAEDGTLDRPALGAIVFSDESARLALNGITHPAIAALRRELVARADERAVIVNDIPLLVETLKEGERPSFDLVVVVSAETETRIGRMMELRGLSREEALRRIESQATEAQRLAVADVVIDSNGTLAETLSQADALWETVNARA
jgi:dephospho-CoA kinase